MSRLIFVVLFGKPRAENHAHESPATMTFPLVVLSIFAIFAGFLGSPVCGYAFQKFILGAQAHAEHFEPDYFMMGVSTVVSLIGIGWAYLLYMAGVKVPVFAPLHRLLSNKYYIDEIYDTIFVKPTLKLCGLFFRFDAGVVDGFVNAVASFVQLLSATMRKVQNGLVQHYMLVQVYGLILLILILF